MPKSKQQKQQEAITRKRSLFHVYIEKWCKCQESGELYKEALKQSKEAALKLKQDSENDLLRAAREAQVDRYGNPL